jgi:hypothetical protein
MKLSLLWYVMIPILLLLFVWHRRPPGRRTSAAGLPDIRGQPEFDNANPSASEDTRDLFYTGVQAHLDADFCTAQENYTQVLERIPQEPTTWHNLWEMEKQGGPSIPIHLQPPETYQQEDSGLLERIRDWFDL